MVRWSSQISTPRSADRARSPGAGPPRGRLTGARARVASTRPCRGGSRGADRSLEIATRTESRKYIVRAWRLEGEAALARRQWDEAERWLGDALRLAQATGDPRQLWKTQAGLGRFHAERRNFEAARRTYQAAREVVDRVLARIEHPGLRAGLERGPLVREIRDRAS